MPSPAEFNYTIRVTTAAKRFSGTNDEVRVWQIFNFYDPDLKKV